MIENLNKTCESVSFRKNAHIRMYNNVEIEAYPPHWHNEVEIILVRSGNLHVYCNCNEYFMCAGDMLIICPSTIHKIDLEPNGSRCYILADMTDFPLLHELPSAFFLLKPAVLISKQTFPDSYAMFYDDFRHIHDLYFDDLPFDTDFEALDQSDVRSLDQSTATSFLPFMNEIKIFSVLLDFIASAAKEVQQLVQKKAEKNPSTKAVIRGHQAVQNACEIVLNEFTNPLYLGDVASRLGFSKFYFDRLFRQTMGIPFYQYVTKVRISNSQILLANSSLSITNIASSCGFSGSSAFSRAFKQETGKSPSDFRELHQTDITLPESIQV